MSDNSQKEDTQPNGQASPVKLGKQSRDLNKFGVPWM